MDSDSSRDPRDDDLRDLLATYRAAIEPPAASELRIRESLRTSVPDWPVPPRPAAESGLISLDSRRRQAVFFLGSAAAAIALTLGLSSLRGEHRQRAQDHEQSPFQRRDADASEGRAQVRDDSSVSRGVVTPPAHDEESGLAETAPVPTADERLDEAPLSVDGGPALAPHERSEESAEGATSAETEAEAKAAAASSSKTAKANRASSSSRQEREENAGPRAEASQTTSEAVASLDLAEELRLIREAENHLRAGRDAQALAVIDRHRRDFPKGQLEPEREASRITALCQQGREPEASAQAQVFAERWPQSPLLPRVRRVCETTVSR